MAIPHKSPPPTHTQCEASPDTHSLRARLLLAWIRLSHATSAQQWSSHDMCTMTHTTCMEGLGPSSGNWLCTSGWSHHHPTQQAHDITWPHTHCGIANGRGLNYAPDTTASQHRVRDPRINTPCIPSQRWLHLSAGQGIPV